MLAVHRERDYHSIWLAILPDIWKLPAREVSISEVQDVDYVSIRIYPSCPVSRETHIFCIRKRTYGVGWGLHRAPPVMIARRRGRL